MTIFFLFNHYYVRMACNAVAIVALCALVHTVGPPNNETFGTQKFFHYTEVFIEEKFF